MSMPRFLSILCVFESILGVSSVAMAQSESRILRRWPNTKLFVPIKGPGMQR